MRQLRLVGLAEDGASVVLATPGGDEYRLPVDERLRAACRGDLTRLGQIEIELENPLRPREIQSRVRAGESPEELAAASGMPVDRVLRFAYPVLQEIQRVVAQARATPLRAKDPAPLGELVEERLVTRGTDPATLRWDAWRREDGQWAVRLRWRHAAEHAAVWTFALAARVVRPDDPAAEQLSGEEFGHRTITAVTPLAAATPVASRRPAPASHPDPAARPAQPARPAPASRRAPAPTPAAAAPAAAAPRARESKPAAADREQSPRAQRRETDDGDGETVRKVSGGEGMLETSDDDRARKASVPSWDDILLGVRRRH